MGKSRKIVKYYDKNSNNSLDGIVSDIETSFKAWLDQYYPVVNESVFFALPIPALYEMVRVASTGRTDGMQLRRLSIVLINALGAYLILKYGGRLGRMIFVLYLSLGTLYYGAFKLIIGDGPLTKGTPDLDPCGNPIVRGDPDGRSGGGGAC